VRLRYRIVARHYRELADREEQSDKARIQTNITQPTDQPPPLSGRFRKGPRQF
jgi:hypothetical protein